MDKDQFLVRQLKKKYWAFSGLIIIGAIGVIFEGTGLEIWIVLSMAVLMALSWLLLTKYSDKAIYKELVTSIGFIFTGISFQMTLRHGFNPEQNLWTNIWLSGVCLSFMALMTYVRVKKDVSKLWNTTTLTFDECATNRGGIALSQSSMMMITLAAMRFTGGVEEDIKQVVGFYALLFSAIIFFSAGIWHLGFFITTVKLNRQHNVNFRDKYLLLLREQNNNSVNQ